MARKMKICTKCGKAKFLSEFYKDSTKKDGLKSYCKEYAKNADRERREEGKAKQAKSLLAKQGKVVPKPVAKKPTGAKAKPAEDKIRQSIIDDIVFISGLIEDTIQTIAGIYGLEVVDFSVKLKPKQTAKTKK